jgi:microsomal dipeptidase-like Zn-dependent dipeptidase
VLVDLHAHYPMHLQPDAEQRTHEKLLTWVRRRWQARLVSLISLIANYQGPGDTPSVTVERMREGDVGVALSVLYAPLDEMDLGQPYGAPPRSGYFPDVLAQLQVVEDHVASRGEEVAVAHSPAELDALIDQGRLALVHCVEGGFHLGDTEQAVREHVRTLAQRGVAYVTIAHLFWREVATNAPALPFLPDKLYNLVFPQPQQGLTRLGRAAVEAMAAEGILIDITHMSQRSIDDTFALLDARGEHTPVIATHMACRFGNLGYCFNDETIAKVAQRGGVLGCILCEHYISNGVRKRVRSYEDSLDALCAHIDRIRDVTGSFEFVAIGSDLDGYIKPALPGLEHMGHMRSLQESLRARYGAKAAEQISSANALRVLRSAWRGHSRASG